MAVRVKVMLAAIGLMVSVSPAMATPVYLSCDIDSFIVKVTADEADGSVSLYMPSTDNREKLRGTFTADKVLFSNNTMKYELSRVDLKIKRVTPLMNWVALGTCVVEQTPKRAF